jgi:hypothetical protein
MESVQEVRLARLVDERRSTTIIHDNVLNTAESREDGKRELTESQKEQVDGYRTRMQELDTEIESLTEAVESTRKAEGEARRIRALLASESSVVDVDGDQVGYRTFAAYARDEILAMRGSKMTSRILGLVGSDEADRARERLGLAMRTPANTLSSDVAGLTPAQHIAQIFQVIDTSRPLVASALRDVLERGVLTYPRVDATPVVAVQSSEKSEAGNTGMDISMQTATASTYLGGGDLSWQAVNWSTPNALDLWFRFAAADYALKTEQDAAQVLQHSGFSNDIASPISGSPTFAQLMTAIGAGYAEVFANSNRIADTIYMAPDRFGYALGLTSDAFAQLVNVGQSAIGPLRVVVSRGMDAGVIVVGDSQGLLVAETGGAPVELQVVEPAIGGYEVGIIGAFEAVVVDDGAFAMITTAS